MIAIAWERGEDMVERQNKLENVGHEEVNRRANPSCLQQRLGYIGAAKRPRVSLAVPFLNKQWMGRASPPNGSIQFTWPGLEVHGNLIWKRTQKFRGACPKISHWSPSEVREKGPLLGAGDFKYPPEMAGAPPAQGALGLPGLT